MPETPMFRFNYAFKKLNRSKTPQSSLLEMLELDVFPSFQSKILSL